MSIGSLNAFIKELERCGLIEITRRGQCKTNLYTINFIGETNPPLDCMTNNCSLKPRSRDGRADALVLAELRGNLG